MSGQEMKSEALYSRSVSSIITLKVTKRDGNQVVGSGFLSLKDGLAVTSWHVVKDANYVVARFSTGEEFEVSGLVDKDEIRDVAIVRVKVFGKPMLNFNSDEPGIGTKVYVIGSPKGLEFTISDGLLSQIQIFEGTKQLQFSCPVSPGNSGGPLLNSRGEVIGVVSWQLREGQNLSFAVPSAYARGLDTSLPTKPWSEVRSLLPLISKQANDSDVDRLCSEILLLSLDLQTALVYTDETILRKGNGFKRGVPSFVYRLQREVKEKRDNLTSLSINDSLRSAFTLKLGTRISFLLESTDLLIEGLRTAQLQGGWSATANDLISRSVAAWEVKGPRVKDILSSVPSVINLLPIDAKLRLGLEEDSTNFRLGVYIWQSDPLLLFNVQDWPAGLAYKLGLRSGDRIALINGTEMKSFVQVKKMIMASLGKNICISVIRNNLHKELNATVPKKLPSE